MSFQAMSWAVSQKCASPGQKLVLLMLANHCNSHTGQCNPSHRLLADECRMGVSTLKTHISALESMGLVVVIHRSHEGVSLPNQYRLSIATPGQNLAGGGSESGYKTGIETGNKNQEETPPVSPKGEATEAAEVKTKRPRLKLKTLSEYIETIPPDEYVIKPADVIYDRGVPTEMIQLAWLSFKERYTLNENHRSKRYKSWVQAFRDHVDGNFLRLWYVDASGQYVLTTVGTQAHARLWGAV